MKEYNLKEMFRMFKLLKRKAWKELVNELRLEVIDLESQIKVYERIINGDIQMFDTDKGYQGELTRIEVYVLRLPQLKVQLENKKQQLKKLKGE
jgi:hypothetical protein